MLRISALLLLGIAALGACTDHRDAGDSTGDILAVMHRAEADWNAGDLEGYMDSYRRSDELRFAGGGGIKRGWDEVLESYRQAYPDSASMGRLHFSDLDVTPLGPDAALVVGRWRIERGPEQPHGVYTLIMRRFDEGWRIVHDHTSAAAAP
jgi:ketosteroid isomerase-like protein